MKKKTAKFAAFPLIFISAWEHSYNSAGRGATRSSEPSINRITQKSQVFPGCWSLTKLMFSGEM
jgi:hypothetical protein